MPTLYSTSWPCETDLLPNPEPLEPLATQKTVDRLHFLATKRRRLLHVYSPELSTIVTSDTGEDLFWHDGQLDHYFRSSQPNPGQR